MMRRARGFTLIEVLIVIVIIGILAGLTLVGVNAAMVTSRINSTETMVKTIGGALEQYRTRWGDYPPSRLSEFGAKLPNDTNNGIESLCACLSSKDRGGILYQPPKEDVYCNTDADKADSNLTNWYFGDNQLREIMDYFGQPMVYLHFKDYAKPSGAVSKYKFSESGDEITIKPLRSGATAAFVNPDKFQLFSIGRDGLAGTEDDIR